MRKRPVVLFALFGFSVGMLFSCASRHTVAPGPGITFKPPLSSQSKLDLEIKQGDEYYHGNQYRCYQCHGNLGEGGRGPKLIGLAKQLGWEKLMMKATHMCPPTGACPPAVLQAIGRYLQTL